MYARLPAELFFAAPAFAGCFLATVRLGAGFAGAAFFAMGFAFGAGAAFFTVFFTVFFAAGFLVAIRNYEEECR